jgi:hypothetical protein
MKIRDGLIAVFDGDPYFPVFRSVDFAEDQNP